MPYLTTFSPLRVTTCRKVTAVSVGAGSDIGRLLPCCVVCLPVPLLPRQTHEIVETQRNVLATSANDPGGPNPARLDDVPPRIRRACGAELDLGPLPGTPSTVIDLTGDEPRILREGAVSAAETLRRLEAAVRSRRPPGEESRWPSPSSRSSS